MCFEGMEESGSEGLDELIEREKDGFFKGTDVCCISDKYVQARALKFGTETDPRFTSVDSYWLNTTTPCLTYGLRGIAYCMLAWRYLKGDLRVELSLPTRSLP